MSVVHVAVALITDAAQRFLITRRALDKPHAGLWEVPGGKIEIEETPYQALVREVHEEVNLQVKKADLIGSVEHDYPDKTVCLHVFQVLEYRGEAFCSDGQLDLRWVLKDDLTQFEFPEANDAIMRFI
ncbi:MAG: 8-oxo-dGTP diphosphatase MutT [Gammaproteobacteria bacterium]|nr:8-oxo-dGTP diphosphatase MutT [Gammaproteobacteria bacterium]